MYQSKPKDFGQAMERKEQSISRFQDTKELSIRIMSAQRDSVLVSINRDSFKKMTDEQIKTEIEKWRAYFFGLSEPNKAVQELSEPF
jgi:hypothetical protein